MKPLSKQGIENPQWDKRKIDQKPTANLMVKDSFSSEIRDKTRMSALMISKHYTGVLKQCKRQLK